MSMDRDNLIKDLVADLKPVKRPGHIGRPLAVWFAVATVYSVLVLLAAAPMREGAFANLLVWPSFAFETLLAILALWLLGRASLRSAIPGLKLSTEIGWPAMLLAAWIGVYIVGLWYPAHPVSTLGARPHCIWQAVLFSLPNLALMLMVARRFFPLAPRTTGMLAGAVAAGVPAALMQFGCMYVPAHILTHHISPIFIVAAIGALVGRYALVGRKTVPRGRDASVH